MSPPATFSRTLVAALAAMLGTHLALNSARAENTSAAPLVVPVVIGDGPGTLIPLVLQWADLDDEQRTDAVQLVEAEGSAIRERLKQIALLDVELAKLMFSGAKPPTQAQLSQTTKRIATLRQEIADREVAILLRFRNLLKPEQRATVTAMDHELLKAVSQPTWDSPVGSTP